MVNTLNQQSNQFHPADTFNVRGSSIDGSVREHHQ